MIKLYIILFLLILIIIFLYKKKEKLTLTDAIFNINKTNQNLSNNLNANNIILNKKLNLGDTVILDNSGNLNINGELNIDNIDINVSGNIIFNNKNFKTNTNNIVDVYKPINFNNSTTFNDTDLRYYFDGVILLSSNNTTLDKFSNPTNQISFPIGTWILSGYDFDKLTDYVIVNPGYGVILYENVLDENTASVKIRNRGTKPIRLNLKPSNSTNENLVSVDTNFDLLNNKDFNETQLPSLNDFFNKDATDENIEILHYSIDNETKYLLRNISGIYVFTANY